jgi:uncharacterized membrane protein YfcA
MVPPEIWITVFVIFFISTFIRSSLGFGDAVVAMPLLTLVVGLKTATPTVALVATTIAITILAKNWRIADLKATLRLVFASFIGIPVGLVLLKGVNEDIMKSLLGAILILYGIYNLWKPQFKKISSGFGLAFVFGFIAGVLGGAYNTNGPPVVIYGTLRRWVPDHFRATMQGYLFPTGFLILLGHGLSGLWTSQVFRYYLFSLPIVFLAIYIGGKAHKAMTQKHFDRYVNVALICMGAVLILRSAF